MPPKNEIPKQKLFEGFAWGSHQPNPTPLQNTANLENTALLEEYEKLMTGVQSWAQTATSSRRNLPEINGYFVEIRRYLFVDNEWIEDPLQYWCHAVATAGPRKWFDVEKVVEVLMKMNPYGQPSSSAPYRNVMTELNQVYTIGHHGKWKPENCDGILYHVPAKEYFEAIRINGDSSTGFGRLPTGITEALVALGLVWVMQPPDEQRIPPFWQEMLDRSKRSIRQYPPFGGKGLLNQAQEEPDNENNQDDTPPGSGSDGDGPNDNDPIIVDDSDDSNTEDLDNEIMATKDSITETLKEILENQKLMAQHQEKQNNKLERLEQAFRELQTSLDGDDYGIAQWKKDIDRLAKAMKMVDMPNKAHKQDELKDAIQTLDNTKRKRAAASSTNPSRKSYKPIVKKMRTYASTIEEDEGDDMEEAAPVTPAQTPKKPHAKKPEKLMFARTPRGG